MVITASKIVELNITDDSIDPLRFSEPLLEWFDVCGRKNLPWQQQPTPYHVWISEIMLQQTQVSTVIDYYRRFIERFPDIEALANAHNDDILALWTGLGYYARARNIHKTATIVVNEHNGNMPNSIEKLIALPGIGRSTAGAIMALAYHQRFAILDGNVKRVLTRYFALPGWPGSQPVERQLWQYAEHLLPVDRIANYIQAQMDLGATLCSRTKPQCERCPLQTNCLAFQQGNPQQYPTSKPKKVIPIHKTNWIVAQNAEGDILLQQRPANGIWGGLWCFPEVKTAQEVATACKEHLNIAVDDITSKPPIRHVFSHFKLDIQPYMVNCSPTKSTINNNKNFSWYKIHQALLLGLPAPVKSFLQSL